jgi:hypothetical protein
MSPFRGPIIFRCCLDFWKMSAPFHYKIIETNTHSFDIQRTVHRDIFLQQKSKRCTISQIYFGTELYMFRTDLLSIIRSLNTVFTAIGICHASYVDCLLATTLADSQQNWHDKHLLLWIQCWDFWWWTVDLSETCRVLYQNKFEK